MQELVGRRVRSILKQLVLVCSLSGVGGAGIAGAQEMEVPVTTQLSLFVKMLAFDRRLAMTSKDSIVIGIVFQSGSRQSSLARGEASRAVGETAANDRRLRVVDIDLDRDDLRSILAQQPIDLLYVAPVRGVTIAEIAALARAAGVTTCSGVPTYVTQGLAVSVRRLGDRPKLVVNLTAARLEGADFSAEFLKVAQVVR